MEALNTILGIIASLISIASAVVSVFALKTARRVERNQVSVKGDSNTVAAGRGSTAIGGKDA